MGGNDGTEVAARLHGGAAGLADTNSPEMAGPEMATIVALEEDEVGDADVAGHLGPGIDFMNLNFGRKKFSDKFLFATFRPNTL
jgi:hypothetical protein